MARTKSTHDITPAQAETDMHAKIKTCNELDSDTVIQIDDAMAIVSKAGKSEMTIKFETPKKRRAVEWIEDIIAWGLVWLIAFCLLYMPLSGIMDVANNPQYLNAAIFISLIFGCLVMALIIAVGLFERKAQEQKDIADNATVKISRPSANQQKQLASYYCSLGFTVSNLTEKDPMHYLCGAKISWANENE